MIDIHIAVAKSAEEIIKELDGAWYKKDTILKDASNAAGKYAMKKLKTGIEKRYDYDKEKIKPEEQLTRKSATYANPRTIINVSGYRNEMVRFTVTPDTLAYGKNRPDAYAARVLAKSSLMEVLENRERGYSKAFMVRFKSGHKSLVQRKLDEDKSRKVKTVNALSVTHMAKGAFRVEESDITEKLQFYVQKNIDKYMKKRGAV